MEEELKTLGVRPVDDELRRKLVNGLEGRSPGILREREANGRLIVPLPHQTPTIYSAIKAKDFFLAAHAMGLGKTCLALFIVCGQFLALDRMPKTVIACPSALLSYWKHMTLRFLRIQESAVLVADKASKMTHHSVRNADIIIVSRDIVSMLFTKCFQRVENQWVRKSWVPLHPIFGKSTRSAAASSSSSSSPAQQPAEHDDDDDEQEVEEDDEQDEQEEEDVPAAAPPQPAPPPPRVQYDDANAEYDLLLFDEAGDLRNPTRKRAQTFAYFSTLCSKRIALTGTPVTNRQSDVASMCFALGAPKTPVDFTSAKTWKYRDDPNTINERTNERFAKHVSFISENEIDLPALNKLVVNFNVEFAPEMAKLYNETVMRAKDLRHQIETSDLAGFRKIALAQLISLIQKLSFMTTCPLIAENGADAVKKNDALIQSAIEPPSSALVALLNELRTLHRTEGHLRIVVAGMHTTLLKIASAYLEKEAPDLGKHFFFDGNLSHVKRDAMKDAFLTCNVGLLFLSVAAGGQGLHLVPGCNAMVLFGSAPWSSSATKQLFKRIHRIGQTKPVSVRYLVAHGSVDACIYSVHGCKERLERMITEKWQEATQRRNAVFAKRANKRLKISASADITSPATSTTSSAATAPTGSSSAHPPKEEDEEEGEEEDEDGEDAGATWKKTSRIVDMLKRVNLENGSFPEMPARFVGENGADLGAFTLVPGVPTRGLETDVPQDAIPLEVERFEREEGDHADQPGPNNDGDGDGDGDGDDDPPNDAIHNLGNAGEYAEFGVQGHVVFPVGE